MTARLWRSVGIVGLAVAGLLYLRTAGSTPPGQPALAVLNDVSALKAEFNRDLSKVRVVVLISASCPYCLKGASETEAVLRRHSEQPLIVLSVWQPILITDWGKPGSGALGRLSDPRVRQFWDGSHHVARALKASFPDREPGCCDQNGVWWDLIAVFPAGVQWTDRLPEPLLLDGTVADAVPAFEALLRK